MADVDKTKKRLEEVSYIFNGVTNRNIITVCCYSWDWQYLLNQKLKRMNHHHQRILLTVINQNLLILNLKKSPTRTLQYL